MGTRTISRNRRKLNVVAVANPERTEAVTNHQDNGIGIDFTVTCIFIVENRQPTVPNPKIEYTGKEVGAQIELLE